MDEEIQRIKRGLISGDLEDISELERYIALKKRVQEAKKTPRQLSFLDCPHNHVQQFTEWCFDCGYNIYTTKQDYLKDLQKKAERRQLDKQTQSIRELEKILNIGN